MIGHTREDLSQAVFVHAKAEALLHRRFGLLEDDDLESVADPADVRQRARWPSARPLPTMRVSYAVRFAAASTVWTRTPSPWSSAAVSPLGIEEGDLRGGGRRARARQHIERKPVLLVFPGPEFCGEANLVMPERERRREIEAQGNPPLFAGCHGEAATSRGAGNVQRPSDFTNHRGARVIDDHGFFFNSFAREEVMIPSP